jgi:prepilin-type N-terminal cleavage/methylation domain-containing protein
MIQRSMAKKRSGEGGFTLVELLIVIVILGILAAIVVLAIGGLKDSAQSSSCKAGLNTIKSAEDAWFAQNNTYGTMANLTGGANKLLKTDPSADFAIGGVTATAYTVTAVGTGQCANAPALPFTGP